MTTPRQIWFENAGTQLFAVELGEGTPIILLHGGLATHLLTLRLAAPLATRFRLIAPDLRASGRSIDAGHGAPLSWDLLADDVAALVRHLGLSRAVIGGVSFGSAVAVRVALRHPEVVSTLIVLTPVFAGADVGLAAAPRAAMDAMNGAGSRAVAEGMSVMHPLLESLPVEIRAGARALMDTYDPASVAASTKFMASGAQPFATASELAAITAPTLVVPGTDPTHPADVAELYHRHLLHGTLRDAGPGDYANVIAEFLDTAG